MLGRVGEEQCKTELVEIALARDFSGKPDENFVGSRKTLAIGEPRPCIDDVNAKARLAGKSRDRHCHLTRSEDKKIRTVPHNLDENLHSGLLLAARRLEALIECQSPGDSLGKQITAQVGG
jgi:hypothetical protein